MIANLQIPELESALQRVRDDGVKPIIVLDNILEASDQDSFAPIATKVLTQLLNWQKQGLVYSIILIANKYEETVEKLSKGKLVFAVVDSAS
jgi:hypothetical protein